MSLSHLKSIVTKNQSRLLRVTRTHPCPVCRRGNWCSYWADGRGAICMRRESDRPARHGQGWMHFFDDTAMPIGATARAHSPQSPVLATAVTRAPVERRHAVYTALLSALALAPAHHIELTRRGLSAEEIHHLQYVSAPGEGFAIDATHQLSRKYDLNGVPGFFKLNAEWRMVRTPPGFLVPYRDECGRIEALQLRRFPYAGQDKYLWLSSKDRPGGVSSGAPVHFARASALANAEEVVITEGALKADVAAHLSRSPVIAAAGVTNFGEGFAARLRASFPHLTRAVIAFDRDVAHNAQVYRALLHLCGQLERARFQVRVRRWPPPAKGYDDFLLSQVTRGERYR